MYTFLCERMHAIRHSYLSRWHDNFWLVSMLVVLLGFGTIAIFCFIEPVSQMSAVFLYLVRPYMRKGLPNFPPTWLLKVYEKARHAVGRPSMLQGVEANALENHGTVERVAWKSLAACIAVMGSTVANLSLLFCMRGYEQGSLCFTLCTIDGEFKLGTRQ
jgi:hypothetical protein